MLLSKYISFENKTKILLFLQRFKKNVFFSSLIGNNKKKVFLFLAADYGNLGDVAITYAQSNFLKEKLPDYEVVDVPISKTLEGIVFIKKIIQSEDIVTIVGGGNFGDLYNQIEHYRQLVISNFKKNRIVAFPQTIDFSKSQQGQKELLKAQKRYGNHNNLTLTAREEVSFKKMKKLFPRNKVILSPDIVMFLNESDVDNKRNGALICLRNDKEKLLKQSQEKDLLAIINSTFNKVSKYDTHINRSNLSLAERNEELQKIWKAFKNSEVVITDRLHGMIFCYITNTPCLVFQNNNHKIKGCYQWIKASSNIHFVEDFNVEFIQSKLISAKNYRSGYISVKNEFEDLIQAFK